MDDSNQSQGVGSPQSMEEVKSQLDTQSETLSERAKTADERLNKFFGELKETPKVEENQPEPTPSSKDQKTEPEIKPTEEKTVVSDNGQKADDSSDQESTNPRTTKRIQELLEENKRLKEEHNQPQTPSSVFDNIPQVPPVNYGVPQVLPVQQFPNLTAQQVGQIQRNFVMPDGTVDIDGMNRALNQADSQALAANQQAQLALRQAQEAQRRIAEYEQTQEVKEAHAKFPELDPYNEKFDQNFFNLVRDRLVTNIGAKKKATLAEVATDIKKVYSTRASEKEIQKAREEAVNEYKTAQAARKQGPIETSKGEPREQSAGTQEELRERTRRGDPFALDERMKRAGIISN